MANGVLFGATISSVPKESSVFCHAEFLLYSAVMQTMYFVPNGLWASCRRIKQCMHDVRCGLRRPA
jgi:hypothetical protein